ncbi:MAG: hypothetical protein N3B10_11860, partial [Armatimonadetes bacterium]|nr:hypothetical protein [Armatimonadota bacterium]
MAETAVLSFPSLEMLLGENFGKLLDATKGLPNAPVWLQSLENSVKVAAQNFGENFVKPFASFALTELDRVLRGERGVELAMLEILCFAKLAAVADEFELTAGQTNKSEFVPKLRFRLADRECAAE